MASSCSISTPIPTSPQNSSPPRRTGSNARRSIAAAASSSWKMRRNTGKPSKTDNRKETQPMAEKERTRERERGALEENTYERSMRARKEWTERGLTGPVVVTQDDREWFQARQGKL